MPEISILKTLWSRNSNNGWQISGMKSLGLKGKSGHEEDYFPFVDNIDLLTNSPRGDIHHVLSSFGTSNFLMQQSILPVVAWNDNFIKCVGTAFIISCTGYLATACHVLLDPIESNYGKTKRIDNNVIISDDIQMGVFMPYNPAYGSKGFRFFPFEAAYYWGEWKKSPLLGKKDNFEYLTDIAICKISEKPDGTAHQPLNLSLNAFKKNENAYALGYAEMQDIPVKNVNGKEVIGKFEQEMFASIGPVKEVFSKNHISKDVPTPGPCFHFNAKIPGKMSGAPIFGADGAVVRGVVSRSFSGEKHAYGSMLGPVMHLPLHNKETLLSLMKSQKEGIAQVQGAGL